MAGFVQELEADFNAYKNRKEIGIQEYINEGKPEKADSLRINIKSYRDFIDSTKIYRKIKVDISFSKTMNLNVGNEQVVLKIFGGGHTGSDVVVCFPNINVAHVGDLCIGKSIPFVDGGSGANIENWIKTLETLYADNSIKTIITGHNSIENKEGLLEMQQMLVDLKAETMQAIDKGLSIEDAVKFVEMKKYADYPSRDLLEKDVRAVYNEIKSKQ